MKRVFQFMTGLLALATFAHAQQDFSKVEIQTIHVAKNIYLLQGAGGNIGVSVGLDGILIVDDQFAPLAEKIEAALKQLNPGKLKFVLNTHYHGDHTGGNAHFGRQAHIIAHANVRKRLGGRPGDSKPELPVITFNDSLSVWFNGEEIQLAHVPPAHTDSDSIIYFTDANVVHFGDTFFSGRFPNIDLGGGGDVRGYIRNVADALIDFARREGITHVIFGQTSRSRWDVLLHGSVINRFLDEVRDATVQVVPQVYTDGDES